MLQQEHRTESQSYEWICEGLSPAGEPCDTSATSHCGICKRWFCAVHIEDEGWHRCALEPGDEGGEA